MNVAEAAMAGIFGSKGSGDVTKEYVDTEIANAVADKVDKVEGKGLSTNDYTNADKALVQGSPITTTSTTSPITNSADGIVQGLTIYGRSEVAEGEIKSVGDDGLTVTTCGKNFFNINGEVNYKWTGTAFVVDTDPATMSTVNDGVLTTKTSLSLGHTRGQIINVEKNRSYTLSLICDYLPQDGKIGVAVYGVNDDGSIGTYKAQIDSTVVGEVQSARFTSSTNRIYVEFGTLRVSGASTYPTGSIYSRIQLEKGSNVTEYEQYRGSTANITTALPLRGVPDTVRDKLTCMADVKQVTKKCGEVDLGTQTITLRPTSSDIYNTFRLQLTNIDSFVSNIQPPKLLSSKFEPVAWNVDWQPNQMSMLSSDSSAVVFTTSKSIATIEDFMTYVSGTHLIYVLAEPVTTPLIDAEISAFRGLRTYDSTTNITITDEPDFEFDYLKNTENGQAVADIQKDLQGQINGLAIKTLTYTGTGTTTNSITFPEKPLMVLGITQHEMESPYQDYHRSIIPFVYDSRSSTMLVQWVKNVDTSSTQYRSSMLYYLTINGNTMTWTAQDASQAFNLENIEYTVYYI